MTRTHMVVWGGLVVAYGLTTMAGVASLSRGPDMVTGAALVLAGLLLAATRHRAAAGLTGVLALLAAAGPAPSTMTVTVGWVGLALALFDGERLSDAARAIGATIYGFAAANKAISPRFVSGDILVDMVPWVPATPALAWFVIFGELVLAVAIAARWPWAIVGVVALHVPIVVFASVGPGHGFTLATYGAMMGWITWTSRGHAADGRTGQASVIP